MHILLLVVLAVVVLSFSTEVRTFISELCNNIEDFFTAYFPTMGTIFGWLRTIFIWLAVLACVIIILSALTGYYWIQLWSKLGVMSLSPTAGMIVGIGAIVGLFIFRGVLRVVTVMAMLVVVFGLCFPEIKGSLNRLSENGQVVIANKIDTQSIQMEPQGVQLATITDDAVLYNDKGQPLSVTASKDTKVKTVSLERRQFPGGPQTFTQVMLPNINGDYLGGSVGWVAIDKVAFGTVAKAPAKVAEATSVAAVPPPVINIYVQSPPVEKPVQTAAIQSSAPAEEVLLQVRKEDRPWTMKYVHEADLPRYNVIRELKVTTATFSASGDDNLSLSGEFRDNQYQGIWRRNALQGKFTLRKEGGRLSGELFANGSSPSSLNFYPHS